MRSLATITLLGAVLSTATACTASPDTAAAPTTSAAASTSSAPTPSTAAAVNTAEICTKLKNEVLSDKGTEEVTTGILAIAIAREAKNTARAKAGEAALTAAFTRLAANVNALAAQANQLAMQQALKETADNLTKSADLLFLKDVDSIQEGADAMTAQAIAWTEPTLTLCMADK